MSISSRKLLSLLPPLLGVGAFGGVLGWIATTLPGRSPGLAHEVQSALPTSGVTNPVTAVLLNFRGYDTLLEVGVLTLALIVVWSIGSAAPTSGFGDPGQVQLALVRSLSPMLILFAGYLLWVGATAPGGAFQAGAVLAALGVLLRLSNIPLPSSLRGWPLRTFIICGLITFLIVGLGVMLAGGRFLQFHPDRAGLFILIIEAAGMISIGFILCGLFAAGRLSETEIKR